MSKYVKLYLEAEIDNDYPLDEFCADVLNNLDMEFYGVRNLHVSRKPFPSFAEKFSTEGEKH